MLVHAGLSTLLVSLGESDQLSTPLPRPRISVYTVSFPPVAS